MNKDSKLLAEAYSSMTSFVYVMLREYNDGREIVYGIFSSLKAATKEQEEATKTNQFTPITSKYTIRKVVINPAMPDADYLHRWSK